MCRTVIKRDGRKVKFDIYKISNAIRKSMESTDLGVDDLLIKTISEDIHKDCPDEISVEDIQDKVELALMNSSRKDVAKSYIAYRNQRAGVTGTWTRSCFLRGDGSMEYLDIYVGGENLMLCADCYIYNSFMSMKQGRQTDGNRWSN